MSVNPLKTKPFSDIKNLKLNYIDESLDYKKTDYSSSEGFDFSTYEALTGFNDTTINNYSYFFLGKKDLFSNWIEYKRKENEVSSYITPIKFILDTKTAYLYFNTASVLGTVNQVDIYDAEARLYYKDDLAQQNITDDNINEYLEYIFIIEFIEGTNVCYIKHIETSKTFYLFNRRLEDKSDGSIAESKDDIHFTSDKELADKFGRWHFIMTEDNVLFYQIEQDMNKLNNGTWYNTKFNVNPENDKLRIYYHYPEQYWYPLSTNLVGSTPNIAEKVRIRTLIPTTNIEVDTTVGNDENYANLTYGRLLLADNKALNPTVDINSTTYVSLAMINKDLVTANSIDNEKYINTSWISYNNISAGDIDIDKSAYNTESQCIFHLQYNNINDSDYSTILNIIPLKNHLSPKNTVIRGEYMNNTEINKPNVDFREYTTLETGHEQEFGNQTITLTYTYYNEEYIIKSGEDLSFTIPNNDNSLPECLRPILYPFNNLNINDTNFIKNGAFGSTIPFLSDKVKKLQTNSQLINNCRYLYTWLYQSKTNPYGIWLDRYYYPNLITKIEAEKGKAYEDNIVTEEWPETINPASYQDIIDKSYVTKDTGFYNEVKNSAFFDKLSDLVFEPSTQYIYSRIGKDEIDKIVKETNEFKISNIDSFDSSSNTTMVSVPNKEFKQSGELDINFKMYINPDKNYGYSFLSNSNTNGLSISNEKNISPFIYTFDNLKESEDSEKTTSYIRLHNHNFDEIKEVNLSELYHTEENTYEEISDLYIPKVFDDLLVTTKLNEIEKDESVDSHIDLLDEPNILDQPITSLVDEEDNTVDPIFIDTSYAFYILSYDLFIKEKFLLKDVIRENKDKEFNTWSLIKSYIKDNSVYLLLEYKDYTPNDDKGLAASNTANPYFGSQRKLLRFDLKAQPVKPNDSNEPVKIVAPSEICKFSATTSKLVFKKPSTLTDNTLINEAKKKLYPVYHIDATASLNLTEDGNIKKAYQENDYWVYTVRGTLDYPCPYGLKDGDEVIVADEKPKYNSAYWYYCPKFTESELITKYDESGIHNSMHIESIYMSNDNELYCFPYYILAHTTEDKHLIGVRERIKNGLYQVEDVDLNEYKTVSTDTGSFNIIFSSYNKIFDLTTDNDGRIGVLKNENIDPEYPGSMQLKMFGNNKKLIQTYTFNENEYENVFALDSLKIYDNGNKNNYITLLAKHIDPETSEVEWRFYFVSSNYGINYIPLRKAISYNLDKTVNYSKNIQNVIDNTLDFNLHLQTKNLLIDHYTYSLNLNEMTNAWYDVRVLVNLNEGTYQVYINDDLLEPNNQITIPKYLYNYKNTFNYPLIIGPQVYRNGQTLANFLNLDPNTFNSTNIKLKNLSIHAKILDEYQYQANKLQYMDLDPLTITLPAGQRNNIEEIIRHFKYIPPGNISNTIRINIKNSGIVKESEQQVLALEILNNLKNQMPLPLNVKEINFI